MEGWANITWYPTMAVGHVVELDLNVVPILVFGLIEIVVKCAIVFCFYAGI